MVVCEESHEYANVKKLNDLPAKWIDEVEQFFVNYHDQEGKKYQLLGTKGTDEAQRLIKKAQKAAQ